MADASIIVKIVDQTRGGLGSVTSQIDGVERSTTRASNSFGGMQRAIGAVAAALSVKAFADFGTEVQNIQNRIALVNPALGTAAENFANIAKVANETFQPLDAVADLYQKVARNAEQYGLNADQVTTVTRTFTEVLRLAGADANSASSAILQFGQALGSGALRGDEFNSIVEATAGEILPILARELGVSAGQVRALAADGQITGQILIDALSAAADDVAARTSNMSVTIGGALTVLQNKFLELGTNATPAFDAVAQAILFVANNLDKVVLAAGVFFGAFAVVKIAAITGEFVALAAGAAGFLASMAPAVIGAVTTAIGTLRAGVLALNATMLTNPIALAVAAISAAILLAITHWDSFKSTAVAAFDAIEIAGLKVQKWFYEFAGDTINTVINAVSNFATRTVGFFKAIGAAALDPLNAFDAFKESMRETEEQIANNSRSTIDFSGKIAELDQRITEATSSTKNNTDAVEDNADENKNATGAVEDNTEATEDNTRETEDNTEARSDAEQQARILAREQEELTRRIEEGTRAVEDSIAAYDNETRALGISQDERDVLNRIIQEEQRYREALGDKVEALTQDQIRLIYELKDVQDAAHLDFLKISDEQIEAIIAGTRARQQAAEERRAAIEAEREAERAAAEAKREEERRAQEAIREQRRITEEFTRDTERKIQDYYRATTTRAQQLEDEKQQYIRRAREQGLENERATQDAIRAYNYEINQAITQQHRDALREQERALSDFRNEYSAVYDDIYGVLEKWTGKSKSELDRYNQYAKLLFGVDLLGSFNTFIDGSLTSLAGWNNRGLQQVANFGNGTGQIMQATGNYVANNVFGANGVASQGIGGFVGYALRAFGSGGGGLLGAITGLFGGLGGTLQNLFGNIFGWISNGLSGVGNFLGNAFSGIVNVGSNIFSGIGNFIGNIASGIGNFFSGLFADGGYIPTGTLGIVGEAGPEFVAGPATVTSARDTASMMRGSGPVNVNFTINAVDSRGIDALLIERKPLIADIVREAVNNSGRRF